ncbi:MAG: hypothetical protein ACT4NV_07570 [Rhodoferax sp.]
MAVAVVGQQLVQGELQVFSDDSGFISLVSDPQQSPVLRCAGRLPYAGRFEREIDLRCSNGVAAQMRLSLRTGLRGFGYGGEGRHSVSLVFGLSPQETASLLRLPEGWSLQYSEGRYWLQARGAESPLPPASAAGASTAPDEPGTPRI